MAQLSEFDLSQKYPATVLETTRLTPEQAEGEVRHIILEVGKPGLGFEAGQSIGVIVPGPHPFGNPYHFRLYSVANDVPADAKTKPLVNICVKRCFYIDAYSGERYKGIASNYLCDRQPGDRITVSGPYGLPFEIPENRSANLLMIGLGTGIAPFRAFVRRIYEKLGGWDGKVRLFYGARTGLEMLYMNDEKNDFAQYYTYETFKAFAAVSPRPHLDSPVAMEQTLKSHADAVWRLILDPETYVYIAGVEKIREMLDKAFISMAGSAERWQRRKAELVAGRRWTELIY